MDMSQSKIVAEAVSYSSGVNAEAKGHDVMEFVADIEPFFYGRFLTYVDVGAYRGDVFAAFQRSSLQVREAHLIEPNPKLQERLQKLSQSAPGNRIHVHHFAVCETPGTAKMLSDKSMSRIIEPAGDDGLEQRDRIFEIETVRLDDLLRVHEVSHVNVLKVDVEGRELQVLRSASTMLEKGSVDFIYIECGMDPENKHLTYYRQIEDLLRPFGYRIHYIYEQKHEWLHDSPILRRANISFISDTFAKLNPYRVTQELFGSKQEAESLRAELSALVAERDQAVTNGAELNRQLCAERDVLVAERDKAVAEITEFNRELFGSRQEAESLRAELSALVAERDQAVTNGAELNRQLRAERDVLVAERDKAVAEMTEFNRHLAKLESGIENFKTEIATREKNRAQVTSKENEKQIAQLKLELDRQRARNERLVRTVSWRVTAPLRIVARWFKSKRKA